MDEHAHVKRVGDKLRTMLSTREKAEHIAGQFDLPVAVVESIEFDEDTVVLKPMSVSIKGKGGK